MDFSNGARYHVGFQNVPPPANQGKGKQADKKEKKEEPTPQK